MAKVKRNFVVTVFNLLELEKANVLPIYIQVFLSQKLQSKFIDEFRLRRVLSVSLSWEFAVYPAKLPQQSFAVRSGFKPNF